MSQIPTPLFIGIAVDYKCPGQFVIYTHDGFWSWDRLIHKFDVDICPKGDGGPIVVDQLHKEIIEYISTYQSKNNCKIIVCGLVNSIYSEDLQNLGRSMWKELDIVPYHDTSRDSGGDVALDEKACSVARKASDLITPSQIPGLFKVHVGYRHEVEVDANGKLSFATLEDYKPFITENTWNKIIDSTTMIKKEKKSIVFINSTPQGGGVAIIRHSTIRFFHLLGIEAHWFVMKPNPEVFEITKKKFHNVLHGVAPKDIYLNEKDKTIWKNWCIQNVDAYWSDPDGPIANADVIVIDDPQPCGTIPRLKELNKNATIVYRSHIELRTDLMRDHNTETSKVWKFLWEDYISKADIFVSHPIAEFVPDDVLDKGLKVKFMPAITDPVDGLNKHLPAFSINYYRLLFNRQNFDQCGKEVDFTRPYFIQISRFDPSKGIPDLIDAYVSFRSSSLAEENRFFPQLLITEHGSIDDPEGSLIYNQIQQKLSEIVDKDIVKDIHVVRLGPSDQMLNTLLSGSLVCFQLSIREGFEIKVSEALMKGIPVVAYRTGGIPLQITEKDGILVKVGDVAEVAKIMARFNRDPAERQTMSENALKINRESILTPCNALGWMNIMLDREDHVDNGNNNEN